MKVLIIGSRGMLGQELVKVFSKENEIIAWDKDDCDITKKDEIHGQIFSLHPELIINAAAYNDVDGAEKEPEKTNLINGAAVGFLAEAAEKLGISIIHYSSDYVFRGDKIQGYAEDDTPDPQSVYAKSKFAGEQELRNNCSKFYLIRLSRLFGKIGNGEGVKKSFVDRLIELSVKQNEFNLVDEEMSSPTYAPDAAKLTFEIVKNKRPFGTYHGANSGACTWFGFAQEIFKMLNPPTNSIESRETQIGLTKIGGGVNKDVILKPVSAAEFPRPAARPKYSILLNTKLPQQRKWEDALKEYLFNL